MASMIWAITCERIIIDRETNQATYVDSVEDLVVPSLPAPIAFAVGVLWIRAEVGERIRIRVSVTDPEGTKLFEKAGDLQHSEALRHRVNLPLIVFTQHAGQHTVMVEQQIDDEWRVEARIPLTITLLPAGEEAAPEPAQQPQEA